MQRRRIMLACVLALVALAGVAFSTAAAPRIAGDIEFEVDAGNQLVVRFRTEELGAMSEVAYGIGDDLSNVTETYRTLGPVHSHVIPDVIPGTVYSFQVRLRDWVGGESVTEVFTFETPSLTSPANVRARGADESVVLDWSGVFGAVEYFVLRSTNGEPFRIIAQVEGTRYLDAGLENGVTYDYRVVAMDALGRVAAPSAVASATAAPLMLRESIDIAMTPAVADATSTEVTGDVIRMVGGGNDVWDFSDSFRYFYTEVEGDVSITVRVTEITGNPDDEGWTKAGVMIRGSLAANSAHLMAIVTTGNGTAMQWRPQNGSNSQNIGGPGYNAPAWVRITRVGNTITAYTSLDGEQWIQIGSTTISAFDAKVYVGVMLTGHMKTVANPKPATATFDNLVIEYL